MKAIILAAGRGTRLKDYTKTLPKGMLPYLSKPLLQWQIDAYQALGITDISIVTGHERKSIPFNHLKKYHNPEYATTNMIESLFCASEELNDDVIVSYSDLYFTKDLLRALYNTEGDVVVAADKAWKPYWLARFGNLDEDLESLTIQDGKVLDLGKPLNSAENLDYRYVGVNKFSPSALEEVKAIYNQKKMANEAWQPSNQPFAQGYMTDLLFELIKAGKDVTAAIVERGWLEFDTPEDFERAKSKQLVP